MVYQRILTVQVCIVLFLVHARLDRLCHTLAHLCRCRLGKGHDKQMVNVHRALRVKHLFYDALHEHRCFSAACSRRDEQIPVTQINDLLLLIGPFHTHTLMHLLMFRLIIRFFFLHHGFHRCKDLVICF